MIEQHPPVAPEGPPVAAGFVAAPPGVLIHLAAVGLLLLAVTLATTGWFSADEVVLRQQSAQLAGGMGWAIEPDPAAAAIDPDHRFVLLARSERVGDQIVPYSKHPLVPLTVAAAEALFGPRGRYLPGALAALAIAAVTSWSFGWDRRALWLPLVGTPLLFHSTVLWAHAAAAAVAAVGFVLLRRIVTLDQPPPSVHMALGLTVALVALLRSEGLLLGAALSLALAVTALAGDHRRLSPWAGLPLLASLLVFAGEPVVRGWLVGGQTTTLGVPASSSPDPITSRLGVAQIMFVEPSIDGTVLGRLRLVGAVLLIVAGVLAARNRTGAARPGVVPLGLAAAGCYGIGVAAGPIPGLLVAAPLLTVALPSIRLRDAGDNALVLTLASFAAAVVATSYDSAGGGDWGARYLFLAVPGMLLLVWPALAGMVQRPNTRPLVAAGLATALLVQAGVVIDLLDRPGTVDVVDAVRDTARHELDEPGTVVAVADERLARFLFDRGLRGPAFHVPSGGEEEFSGLLDAAGGIDRIIWVDLSSTGSSRPGTLVETHGSVEMRTLVRR